jgi:phage baseplate assembly protein W
MTIRGLAWPFNRSSTSFPAVRTDADVIADNVARIINTPRGSRVMRADAGSDAYSFVFENSGPLLQARMDNEVRRAVGAGEPRARILAVLTSERETDTGIEVVVDVHFEVIGQIRRSTVTFSP